MMSRRLCLLSLGALVCAAATSSCFGCGRVLADPVGAGVARLSVRDAAALMVLVLQDADCGFESARVRNAVVYDAPVGDVGEQRFTVQACTIELAEPLLLSKNCDEEELTVEGRVEIDAVWTTRGLITGNPESPIAPIDPDASRFAITARFDGFTAKAGANDPVFLERHNGTMSFQMTPRLAALYDSPGLCGFATPNLAFSGLTHEAADVTVYSDQTAPLATTVTSSSLRGQVGRGASDENTIEGVIDVYDSRVELPLEGDDGLDPDYDAQAFEDSYMGCVDADDALAPLRPLSFVCPGLDRIFALSGAQQFVGQAEALVGALEDDETCGFNSPGATREVVGATGEVGEVRVTVDGCTIAHADPHPVDTDCQGQRVFVQGAFTAGHAVRVEHGLLTGDVDAPIEPVDDASVHYLLEDVTFASLHVIADRRNESVRIDAGTMRAEVTPRFAQDAFGVCGVQTATARLNVELHEVDAQLLTAQTEAHLLVDDADLEAVRGQWGDDVNTLTGAVTLGGETFAIEKRGGILETLYTQAEFDARWDCNAPDPVSFSCSAPDE